MQRWVVVLSRAAHRNGVWVTHLVDQLAERHPSVRVEVVDVETVSGESLFPACSAPRVDLLVNRVSDAANPSVAKTCLALLTMCDMHKVPVVNGAKCYAIGTNKVLHHHTLALAGCAVPRSVVIRADSRVDLPAALADKARDLIAQGSRWPLLVKPNAGGFGDGIQAFFTEAELTAWGGKYGKDESAPRFNDDVMLLQEYCEPRDGAIYRIWFLGGRVQCAVKLVREELLSFSGGCVGGVCARSVGLEPPSAFQSGCVGSACPRPDPTSSPAQAPSSRRRFTAWAATPEVRAAVERVAALTEADCGSVELLYEQETGQAVYFDVNMLSTLPAMDGSVADPDELWGPSFNAYAELADYAIAKLQL